jgi:hypothetical protein
MTGVPSARITSSWDGADLPDWIDELEKSKLAVKITTGTRFMWWFIKTAP